ncbi:MAG: sigma-70 family RNA polymerase sigma factor [Planctomycetota bacterium]
MDIPYETVALAASGDQEACRSIVEALHRPMLSTIHRFLGRRFAEEVEDVAQEVFLKVFRTLDRFDPGRGVKFSTWVFTFVRNHCFDVLKKKRLRTISMQEDGADGEVRSWELEDGTERRPEHLTLSAELGDEIEKAMATLNEEQRMVFILREFEQLDLRSIAEIMDCSEGTVKSRLHRAKEAMKQRLAPYLRT